MNQTPNQITAFHPNRCFVCTDISKQLFTVYLCEACWTMHCNK